MRKKIKVIISALIIVQLLTCAVEPIYISARTINGNVIQVDGNYTDWNRIPHTDISWYSPDPNQVHKGALYLEDDILYVHYKMNDAYRAQMVLSYMELTINDTTNISITMQKKNSDGTIDWSDSIYNLPVGTTDGLGIFYNEYPKYYMGDVTFTVYELDHTVGDEAEFAIDLNVVSKITNIPVESMRQISLFNPNIGKDVISVGGSSSGATVGVLALTGIATVGVFIDKKRKKVVD